MYALLPIHLFLLHALFNVELLWHFLSRSQVHFTSLSNFTHFLLPFFLRISPRCRAGSFWLSLITKKNLAPLSRPAIHKVFSLRFKTHYQTKIQWSFGLQNFSNFLLNFSVLSPTSTYEYPIFMLICYFKHLVCPPLFTQGKLIKLLLVWTISLPSPCSLMTFLKIIGYHSATWDCFASHWLYLGTIWIPISIVQSKQSWTQAFSPPPPVLFVLIKRC